MLIRRAGESKWRAPETTGYTNEDNIQTIIEQSPDLWPGSTNDRMAVARELPVVDVGSVDVVGIAADGAITIVECKLKANSEIRRRVVGQILAYAAGLWGLAYEDFDAAFASRVGSSLANAVAEFAPEEWSEERFRDSVATNLRDGRFRLVIAVDEITSELEKIVRYLNEHTSPELQVLALSLGYVADGDVEILLPMTYGRESVQRKVEADRRKWMTDSVFEAFQERSLPPLLEAVERLRGFVVARGGHFVPGTGAAPSAHARLPFGGKSVTLFYLQANDRFITMYVGFGYLADAGVSPDVLTQFAERLVQIQAIDRSPTISKKFRVEDLQRANFKKWPGLALDDLVVQPDGSEALAQLERALDGLIQSLNGL